MENASQFRPQRVRTVCISDVHLGFRGCSAQMLLGSLHTLECETLYLVGDIVDARRRGGDGVVCGHIHHAEIRDIDGIAYHNCGDWVESNSPPIERFDGRIELLCWSDEAQGGIEVTADAAAAAVGRPAEARRQRAAAGDMRSWRLSGLAYNHDRSFCCGAPTA